MQFPPDPQPLLNLCNRLGRCAVKILLQENPVSNRLTAAILLALAWILLDISGLLSYCPMTESHEFVVSDQFQIRETCLSPAGRSG